jgi:CcmD family protein
MTKTDGKLMRMSWFGNRVNNISLRTSNFVALLAVVFFVVSSVSTVAIQPPPVEEFVPIGELPEEDRLPAAPFLVSAYSLVWIFAFWYFWMLSRRLSVVERELNDLTKRAGLDSETESERAP